MFKLFKILARGAAAQAEEELFDRHALLVLDQQIRETRASLERSKLALANLAVTMLSVTGKDAMIETTIDPSMLFLGHSNGLFEGASPSALPKDWNM